MSNPFIVILIHCKLLSAAFHRRAYFWARAMGVWIIVLRDFGPYYKSTGMYGFDGKNKYQLAWKETAFQ